MEVRRRVIWSPASRQDLLDIWSYFARVASPEIADSLLYELDLAMDRLARVDPRMYRVRTGLFPDSLGWVRSAEVHPYAIFYRIRPEDPDKIGDVEIIRVLHQSRDLPSILVKIPQRSEVCCMALLASGNSVCSSVN